MLQISVDCLISNEMRKVQDGYGLIVTKSREKKISQKTDMRKVFCSKLAQLKMDIFSPNFLCLNESGENKRKSLYKTTLKFQTNFIKLVLRQVFNLEIPVSFIYILFSPSTSF